jgi:O-acetyl-ADP-ribose deacetylase (regulator of RNase III)
MTETIAAAVAILALAALAALMLAASTGLPFRVRHRPALRIEVVIGDITTQRVDVIVNAAKSSLLGGGGVDGAIHQAGGPAILRECRDLRARQYPGGLPAGQAALTGAGRLPAEHVIHTVGPMYDPFVDQSAILRSCYTESLARADEVGARTAAFPLISAGVYGWPKDDAVRQALAALRTASTRVKTVRLVMFDEGTYRTALAVDSLEDF